MPSKFGKIETAVWYYYYEYLGNFSSCMRYAVTAIVGIHRQGKCLLKLGAAFQVCR